MPRSAKSKEQPSRAEDRARRTAARFDESYYERHYLKEETRVSSPVEIEKLGAFVCAYVDFLDVQIERVLDLGCGLGWWQDVIKRNFPEAEYVGVEISEYVCKERGFELGSVVDYDGEPADLVICQGVLQYLDDDDADRAIANLSTLATSALYLEALTQRDWDEACSQDVTDGEVFLRDAVFYERRLAREFIKCGGGLFVKRDAGIVLYDLERA